MKSQRNYYFNNAIDVCHCEWVVFAFTTEHFKLGVFFRELNQPYSFIELSSQSLNNLYKYNMMYVKITFGDEESRE